MGFFQRQWNKIKMAYRRFKLNNSTAYKISVLRNMLDAIDYPSCRTKGLCILATLAMQKENKLGYFSSIEVLEALRITHFMPPKNMRYSEDWWFTPENMHLRRLILWRVLEYHKDLYMSQQLWQDHKIWRPVEPLPEDPIGWMIVHSPSFKNWCIYRF